MTLEIITRTISHFDQNCRIVIDRQSNEAIVIDPGYDAEMIYTLTEGMRVRLIVLTHCHLDHAGAAKALLALYKTNTSIVPRVIYHSKESIIGEYISSFAKQYGFEDGQYTSPPPPDIQIETLNTIDCGSFTFEVLHTPGHSPGHVSLYCNTDSFLLSGDYTDKLSCSRVVIAGDALFSGSIGRTDLPLSDHDTLIHSIRSQLLSLPDDTLVCCGHGPNTTIRQERCHNPFLS